MVLIRLIPLLFGLLLLASCGSHDPLWRMKAQLVVAQLEHEQAEVTHPNEYQSLLATFRQGEHLLVQEDDDEAADQQFLLAYQKGQLLKQDVARLKERRREEALQREIEERILREEEQRAAREAERLRRQELEEAQRNLHHSQRGISETTTNTSSAPAPQPSGYTVRRGETLPQIAARPEIYNDAALWPLIYRANRDQIRDPYQLWPGQSLRIPRSFSRDDALEARRQAHRR